MGGGRGPGGLTGYAEGRRLPDWAVLRIVFKKIAEEDCYRLDDLRRVTGFIPLKVKEVLANRRVTEEIRD